MGIGLHSPYFYLGLIVLKSWYRPSVIAFEAIWTTLMLQGFARHHQMLADSSPGFQRM
jgi:hypothetical protein